MCRLALHAQEKVFTDAEVKEMLTKFDELVQQLHSNKKQGIELIAIEEEAIFYLEAYKHYLGIEKSNNGEVLTIADLRHYLAYQTGRKKNTYVNPVTVNTDSMPRMLFI